MAKPSHADDALIELLPGQLRPVAEICGFEAIEALIKVYGGQRLYVPKVAVSQAIVHQCGRPVAAALHHCYGGEYVVVPLARALAVARKHQAIRKDQRAASEVARDWKMSVNSVHRIRGEKAKAPKRAVRPPGRPRSDAGIVDLEELIDGRATRR
jgi:hypothetical protein